MAAVPHVIEPPATTAQAGPDPSGVPRPASIDRVPANKANSGVIVGEAPVAATTGQPSDTYKTAYIKVYQDAGVIGAAMLTLITLCVLLAIFSFRLLKMYTTLITANAETETLKTAATEKLSVAVMLLGSKLDSTVADRRRENESVCSSIRELYTSTSELRHQSELGDQRAQANHELLTALVTKLGAPRP